MPPGSNLGGLVRVGGSTRLQYCNQRHAADRRSAARREPAGNQLCVCSDWALTAASAAMLKLYHYSDRD